MINYVSNQDRAEILKRRLSEEYPDIKVVTLQADVGTKDACEKLVRESIEALSGLDIIISNAVGVPHLMNGLISRVAL